MRFIRALCASLALPFVAPGAGKASAPPPAAQLRPYAWLVRDWTCQTGPASWQKLAVSLKGGGTRIGFTWNDGGGSTGSETLAFDSQHRRATLTGAEIGTDFTRRWTLTRAADGDGDFQPTFQGPAVETVAGKKPERFRFRIQFIQTDDTSLAEWDAVASATAGDYRTIGSRHCSSAGTPHGIVY